MSYRVFIALCLALAEAVLASPVFATTDAATAAASRTTTGGLICFSIELPARGGPSCDKLCADKDGACVGLKMNGAINPGIGCADAIEPTFVASCRCCTLGK